MSNIITEDRSIPNRTVFYVNGIMFYSRQGAMDYVAARRARELQEAQDLMLKAEKALDQARHILFMMPDTKGALDHMRHEMFNMSTSVGQMRQGIAKMEG